MIETLITIRKNLLKYLTILSPVITIILVYKFNVDIAAQIAKFSPSLKTLIEAKPALGFTINTAFFVLLINLFIEIFKHPGEFKVELKNNSRKSDSYFNARGAADHNPITVHMDCKFDFKNKFIYWLVRILGGLTINTIFPHWVTYRVINKKDMKKGSLTEQLEEFQIDVEQALQKKKVDVTLYVNLSIISNSFDVNNGVIKPSVELKTIAKWKKFFLYLIIALFFDIKISEYKVEARTDIN